MQFPRQVCGIRASSAELWEIQISYHPSSATFPSVNTDKSSHKYYLSFNGTVVAHLEDPIECKLASYNRPVALVISECLYVDVVDNTFLSPSVRARCFTTSQVNDY